MGQVSRTDSNEGTRQWWVARNGQVLGPFSTAIVAREVRSGRLPASTDVIPAGGNEWKPLRHWPDFTDVLPSAAGVRNTAPASASSSMSSDPRQTSLDRDLPFAQRSMRLVIAFSFALLLVLAALDLLSVYAFGNEFFSVGNLQFLLGASSVILIPALWRWLQLKQGASFVAEALGAHPIPPDTSDPQLVTLRRITENLARKTGIPTPRAHVIPDEETINAFAAGLSREDTVIGVTQGALYKLDEKELEGVVGHEISHLVNADSTLHARLIAMLFGLGALIVLAALGVLFAGEVMRQGQVSRSSKDQFPTVGIGLALIALSAFVGLVGGLGWLTGRLLAAAVSRQREFLADAGAARITGHTTGILGALRKMATDPAQTRLLSKDAGVYQHIFLSTSRAGSWLDSHPALADRIAFLEGLTIP